MPKPSGAASEYTSAFVLLVGRRGAALPVPTVYHLHKRMIITDLTREVYSRRTACNGLCLLFLSLIEEFTMGEVGKPEKVVSGCLVMCGGIAGRN